MHLLQILLLAWFLCFKTLSSAILQSECRLDLFWNWPLVPFFCIDSRANNPSWVRILWAFPNLMPSGCVGLLKELYWQTKGNWSIKKKAFLFLLKNSNHKSADLCWSLLTLCLTVPLLGGSTKLNLVMKSRAGWCLITTWMGGHQKNLRDVG